MNPNYNIHTRTTDHINFMITVETLVRHTNTDKQGNFEFFEKIPYS